jgi:2-oxoglutarate dehydrogenase E1 component
VQEEPENMGAWTYILRVFYSDADVKFRFLGRKVSASPATGYKKVHDEEQAKIIHQAFA